MTLGILLVDASLNIVRKRLSIAMKSDYDWLFIIDEYSKPASKVMFIISMLMNRTVSRDINKQCFLNFISMPTFQTAQALWQFISLEKVVIHGEELLNNTMPSGRIRS